MRRRIPAALLALLLVIPLCGFHVCSGEDCLICAQIGGERASLPPLRAVYLFCFLLCAAGKAQRCFRVGDSAHTLITLKVKLSD